MNDYERLSIFEEGRAAGRAEAKAERDHEASNRLTAAIITGGLGVVAALFTGIFAWDQKNEDVAAIRSDIQSAGGCKQLHDLQKELVAIRGENQQIYGKTLRTWAILETITRKTQDEKAETER